MSPEGTCEMVSWIRPGREESTGLAHKMAGRYKLYPLELSLYGTGPHPLSDIPLGGHGWGDEVEGK